MSINKVFGYIRVSTKDQNIDRQLISLKEIGVGERDIFIDKASGKHFDRAQYQALKGQLPNGDLVYFTSLDRLGRNSREINNEWREITAEIGADIVVMDMPLLDTRQHKDTLGTFVSDLVLQVLSFIAENEREKTLSRQKEGIAAARLKGKHLGRPKINFETLSIQKKELLKENYFKWLNKEVSSKEFMELLNLNKNTFYKIIKQYSESI